MGVAQQTLTKCCDSCHADTALSSANKYRSQHHNTPPMKWCADLAKKSQVYAEHLLKETQDSGNDNNNNDNDNPPLIY